MPLRRTGKRKFNLYHYLQRTKKFYYNRGDDKMLDSGFTVGQTYGGLYKAWAKYIISKSPKNYNYDEHDIAGVASFIQKLEGELNLPKASFPELKMTGLGHDSDHAYHMADERKGDDEVTKQMLEELECKDWESDSEWEKTDWKSD